jgi:hypothetical protein
MSAYTRPLHEYDEIEVERLISGDDTIPLRRAIPGTQSAPLTLEVVEAVRRLTVYGYSSRQISERLRGRIKPNTIRQLRGRYGIQPRQLAARGTAAAA